MGVPWGNGPPGLAHRVLGDGAPHLGEPFDIHGGGEDLIFPHHENEIAQSQGADGDGTFARYWLHNGFLNFDGEKMSKSLGNFVTIRKVAETYDLEALRLHLIGVHYRSPVAFTIAHDDKGHARYPEIDEAESRLAYYYRTLEKLAAAPGDDDGGAVVAPADQTISGFREAMDDDFNTAAAIGHLSDAFLLANKLFDEPAAAAKDVRRRTLARLRKDLAACGSTLGIFQRPPSAFLDAYRLRLCARRGIEPGGRRGAHQRAHRRPQGQGLRPRR